MIREFLRKVRSQRFILQAYEEELARVRADVAGIKGQTIGERVQSGKQTDLSEAVIRLETYEKKVRDAWCTLIEMKEKAEAIIQSEPDEKRRAVLYRRYILCERWEVIAEKMGFEKRYMQKIHGEALDDLEKRHKKTLSTCDIL